MSSNPHNPLAILRGHSSQHLARIAESHLQNDLSAADREKLKAAAARVSTHATIGSFVGLALGVGLARRIRLNRIAMFRALRAAERPVEVVFSNGRREAIPDLEPLLRPTGLGDMATFGFFGLSGLFIGGETGFWTGTASARRSIREDPAFMRKIEDAFRKFRIDALKEEIKELESAGKRGESGSGSGSGSDGSGEGEKDGAFGWEKLESAGWRNL